MKSGFVSLLGRPNAGKSTLLNRLVGQKLAIVSDKPQTTRRRIFGVANGHGYQLVLVDMPGFQRPRDTLTERMQRTVDASFEDVDAVLLVVDCRARIGAGDRFVAKRVFALGAPVVIALNKVDRLKPGHVATQMATAAELGDFVALHPVSAKTGDGVGELRDELVGLLPEGPAYFPAGRYLVVLNMEEARLVCDWIESGIGGGSRESGVGDRAGRLPALQARFAPAISSGFDFTRDLERVGVANQTTMLSSESLAIAEEIRRSMVRRYGEEAEQRVRTFDTICSATQERQDAVLQLLEDPPDLLLVIGGYNSSNTTHLAKLSASRGVRTYHLEDAAGIEVETGALRHRPIGASAEIAETGWLDGARTIGITAGASTPNNKIGETMARVAAVAGCLPELEAAVESG